MRLTKAYSFDGLLCSKHTHNAQSVYQEFHKQRELLKSKDTCSGLVYVSHSVYENSESGSDKSAAL